MHVDWGRQVGVRVEDGTGEWVDPRWHRVECGLVDDRVPGLVLEDVGIGWVGMLVEGRCCCLVRCCAGQGIAGRCSPAGDRRHGRPDVRRRHVGCHVCDLPRLVVKIKNKNRQVTFQIIFKGFRP